ncbi:autophagy-related protein 27 [Mycena galopus ATCC 62051]|nr:autophagy-related protein 27 [Mycena galopus ATCC 62051]
MDPSLFLLLLSLSIPALALDDPFNCQFQVGSLKYDLQRLDREYEVHRERPLPPTRELEDIRISLCSDLTRKEGVDEGDQCPAGTRICLTRTNHKDGSDRIVSVIPLAQTSALDPLYTPLSSPKGVSILLHGGSYPHPINTNPSTLHCCVRPGRSETEPKFISYDGARLELEWSSEAGCGFAAEKDGESAPGDNGGSTGSTSLSSLGWFLLLLLVAFATYMGLGAYYNYSTYGASGIDLIPHRDFWREAPYILVDCLGTAIRPRRSSSHRGGYVAV